MSNLIDILKKLKNSCPWLWDAIEYVNGLFVKIVYGRRLNKLVNETLNQPSYYRYRRLYRNDAARLVQFIDEQPEGFDLYFKPHKFDIRTFKHVLSSGTYVLIGAFDAEKLIGYCFIRFFVNKSAFRGKIVDANYRGLGIAKQMGKIMTQIASELGFRVYATISKSNVASLQSAKSGSQIKVIKELPDNYLYIELLRDSNYVS